MTVKFSWQKGTTQGITIRRFLSDRGLSHRVLSRINHHEGQVRVDDRKVRLQAVVDEPATVTVMLPPEHPDENVPPSTGPLAILAVDENWLVIDKPAGMTSVPGPHDRQDTLVNRVKGYLMQQGARDLVPHVITRLDRFTSGVTLVARHRVAQGLINPQVEQHTLRKEYLAVVRGALAEDHGFFTGPLERQPGTNRQWVSATGKPARTEYWVTARYAAATQVRVRLHTGRTHQIRAHFAAAGHPLLGDELYGGPTALIERQALHARALGFTDPFTDRAVTYCAPIPPDLQQLLATLQ